MNRVMKSYLLILCLLLSVSATAEIYKWVDDAGGVHYGDRPNLESLPETVDVRINSYKSVDYKDIPEGSRLSVQGKVVMYSTSWCGYCKKARQYFRHKGIPFLEYDIEKNTQAKREYDTLGGRGVPVILVGKKRMNGFSQIGFERIYQ